MKNSQKAQIVEKIAQYNTDGTQAIEQAYNMYIEFGGTDTSEQFELKVKGEANSKLSDIDSISFMYDVDREEWASEEEMVKWYDSVII